MFNQKSNIKLCNIIWNKYVQVTWVKINFVGLIFRKKFVVKKCNKNDDDFN